jgi:hypothetical protein
MKTTKLFICLFCLVISLGGCRNHAKTSNNIQEDTGQDSKETMDEEKRPVNDLTIIYSENKDKLKAYYELPHIKEYYGWMKMSYIQPPALDNSQDLKSLSYDDLRLLRNEVFARNGYLFKDAFFRGYFNRYNWYMPVFDVDTFKVLINNEEQTLIDKILAEEARRKENSTIKQGDLQIYNSGLIVNKKQFISIPETMQDDFSRQNFSIVSSNRAMPFHVYDENSYQYIPHYITTDLFLFILHKYFSSFLEKMDENYMYDQLHNILTRCSQKLNQLSKNDSYSIRSSIEWSQMYTAIALYAIGDSLVNAPDIYIPKFRNEKSKIDKLKGNPEFIDNEFVDYGELKARGHYTKSKNLQKYFRGFKWISLNGIDINNDEQLKGLILFAQIIKSDEELLKNYNDYRTAFEKLAGKEDNLSLYDLIDLLPRKTIPALLSMENVNSVKEKLKAINKEKIKSVFGESFDTKERNIKRLYFLSGTYSVSGEIFSRLVHIDWTNSKRPFPRGLDIPAVFGNQTAQNIIVNEYKDNEKWPEYLSRLSGLQDQFSNFKEWNDNYGSMGLKTALSASSEEGSYPDFMKTDAYNRKELSTSLASWTHIKHDLILYQEKPYAAEAGEGGGPEPPVHYSYVEPNLKFWDSALELVDWLQELAKNESTFVTELTKIKELGNLLKSVAYKEIEGKEVTESEYRKLHYIGGSIEYILLDLLETDHLPEREKSMALIADAYVYNGDNLNVAVGHGDDIYAIVPIKGEYHISRGFVFSYYEFIGEILNDEEWKARINRNEIPPRPEWLKPIVRDLPPLKSQLQFRE